MTTLEECLINTDAIIYLSQQRQKQRLLDQLEYHERRIVRLNQLLASLKED